MPMLEMPKRSRRSRMSPQISSTVPQSACGGTLCLFGIESETACESFIELVALVGDDREVYTHPYLELSETVARNVTDPGELSVRCRSRCGRARPMVDHSGWQRRVQVDDIGVACGYLEHLSSTAAHTHRRRGALQGERCQGEVVDVVVRPVVGEGLSRPQRRDDAEGLVEPLDTNRWGIQRQPCCPVVGQLPTGAEAELESATAELVDRRRLLGQHDWMSVVVGEDQCADPQRRGGICGGHQRSQGGELVIEMVGHREH